jgi:ribosomal protein S18 acetylase RimI-like enzyme
LRDLGRDDPGTARREDSNVTAAIRPFAPADADRIVELSLAAWQPVFDSFRDVLGAALYERVHPDWRAAQAASVMDALRTNDSWVSTDEGSITGFVNVRFDAAERSGEIYMIAVDPDCQRQGIATRLTEHALEEMRARGLDLAIVATGGDPGHAPARRTYERAGFTGCPQVWYARQL